MDASKTADRISLHVGLTQIVDANNQIPLPAASVDKAPAGNYLTVPSTLKVQLNPDRYPGTANAELRRQLGVILTKKYTFVRVGVRTTSVTQRLYSQSKELKL
jgi:hypothetical protein